MVAQSCDHPATIHTIVFAQAAAPTEAPICLLPVVVPTFLGVHAVDVLSSISRALARYEHGRR